MAGILGLHLSTTADLCHSFFQSVVGTHAIFFSGTAKFLIAKAVCNVLAAAHVLRSPLQGILFASHCWLDRQGGMLRSPWLSCEATEVFAVQTISKGEAMASATYAKSEHLD